MKAAVVLTVAFLALTAVAVYDSNEGDADVGDTFDVGTLTYTVLDGSNHVSVKMKSVTVTTGNVGVPSTVVNDSKEYTVTEIAENGFKDNTNITGITVPATLTKIGDHAFDGCTNLRSVNDFYNEEVAPGYKALEYIQSTGTQYIDTGVVMTSNFHFNAKFNIDTSDSYISGATMFNNYLYNALYKNAVEYNYGNSGIWYTTGVHVVSQSLSNGQLTMQLDDDEPIVKSVGTVNASDTDTYRLFGSITRGLRPATFYYFQIMNGNDNTVTVDLIPCLHTSDNAVGMYDLVSKTFFSNAGKGSFIAGPVLPQVTYYESVLSLSHVTTIGDYAFSGVSGMETVYLPEVTSIGKYAFSGFGGIEYITGTYVDLKQDIPAEYMQLEYIESSGMQYINTGITSWNNTLEYEIKLTRTTQGSGTKTYFGSCNAWSASGYVVPNISTYTSYRVHTDFKANFPASSSTDIGIDDNETGIISLKGDKISWSAGGVASFDRGSSFSVNSDIVLFCMNMSGSKTEYASYPLYYAKFWLDGTLVRDLVPCIRFSDGAVGMYDRVSGDFLGNSGTGSFIPGPAVFSGTMYVPKVTSVGDYAFSGCGSLLTAKLDKVTSTGSHLFDGCTKLKFMGFDSLVDVGEGTFMGSGVEVVSTDEKYKASEYHPIQSRLPEGYTEVEYIQSTGTQAIDTGVVPTNNMKTVLDADVTFKGETDILGASSGDSQYNSFLVCLGNSSGIGYVAGAYMAKYHRFTADGIYDTRHVFETEMLPNSQSLKIDGVLVGSSNDTTTCDTHTLALFARNYGSYAKYAIATVYSLKIYDSGSLVLDLVPCISSTGGVGMYDLVSNTFHGNKGTGSFIAGPDYGYKAIPEYVTVYLPLAQTIGASTFEGCTGLFEADLKSVTSIGASAFEGCTGIEALSYLPSVLPAGYKEVEYIESNGTQYLNVGHLGILNKKVSFSITPQSISGDSMFIGCWTTGTNTGIYLMSLRNNSYTNWQILTSQAGGFIDTGVSKVNQSRVDVCYDGLGSTASVTVNGVTTTSITKGGSYTVAETLFCLNENDTTFSRCFIGQLNSHYIVEGSDGIEFEGVPCIRQFDSAVGMYDLVTKKFFGNAGTGSFEAGPLMGRDISAPSLQTIGESAFEGCTSLETVDLPDLTSMGASAFKGCTSLETVDLSSLETVSDHAFEGCAKLSSADFEDAISVGESAFEGCEAVESVGSYQIRLPDGYTEVKYIESSGKQYINMGITTNAFYGFSLKYAVTGATSSQFNVNGIFGANNTGYDSKLWYNTPSSTVSLTMYNKSTGVSGSVAMEEPFTLVYKKSGASFNGRPIEDYVYVDTHTGSTTVTIAMFGAWETRGTNFLSIGRMYYFKAYDNDENLIGDFVPCISPTDEVGMYDLVSKKFFGNASGTGSFKAGPQAAVGNIYVPSLQTIGDSAFKGCVNLENVDLSNVGTVSNGTFIGLTSLKTVNLPSVTSVGTSAFAGCTKLSEVSLSETSGCSIGDEAFLNAGSDTANGLIMKALFFKLGTKVFGGTKIYSINSGTAGKIVMDSIQTLPEETFVGMTGATQFEADSMVAILGSAFKNTGIKTVSVPQCKNIGSYAFSGCSSLADFTMSSDGGGILDSYAFCGAGTSTSGGTTFVGKMMTLSVATFKKAKLHSINGDAGFDFNLNGVERIYDSAFEESSVTTVNIPNLVGMNEQVFLNCGNLTSVAVKDTYSGKINNSTFSGCSNLQSVTARGVTVVGESAFKSCKELVTVQLSSSCESVGKSAFEGCSKFDASAEDNNNIVNRLKTISDRAFMGTATVKLESTVAGQTIGDYAFSNCSKLTKVESDAVSVGEYAFYLEGGTSKLESVVLNKLTEMGAHAFDQCRNLTSVQANMLKTVPAYAFNECSGLESVQMSEAVIIGDYAFCNTYISKFNSESYEANLQTVVSIGKYAFYLNGFGTVNAGSLSKIGDSAFGNSVSIRTFYAIYVKEIGKEAFMGCTQLSVITDNVADPSSSVNWKTDRSYLTRTERVGMDAFNGTRITDLATGEIAALSAGAFRGMGYLEEIILQGSIQVVPDSAFSNCSKLKDVHLCSSITSIGEGAFAGTSGVKVYAGSETLGGDTSGITVITIATQGVVSGTVTTVAGNNWTQRRVITGNRFTLPYDDEGNSREMVLVLTTDSGGTETKYQLLAGRSGDVVTAYPEVNSSMTFGEKMDGNIGFEIQATFSNSAVFGGAQTVWTVTKYAETITLPVPLDGIVEGALFTHYYGIESNRTYADPNGAETIQSPIPVTVCFYETEFELKSSQDKYKITLNYNSSVATGHENETFEKKSGETFNLPGLPNVNGYTAVGWFYDALGTKPAPASFTVSKSQTFYAYYIPKTVTVTIMHEGIEMAKVESKQYVKLVVYNRGDADNPGFLYVKGVNGLNQTVRYSDDETSDHFDPSIYGNSNGYDFYYYTINNAKYADSSSGGSSTFPTGESLSYTDVIVEVFYTERTYDIKIQNYDIGGNPLSITVQIDGVTPTDGYWKKELNFQQVQYGVTFPIQKVSASGWTFHHAGVFYTVGGAEQQHGPYYGMDAGYTQSDIVINLESFNNQRELTVKLFFETGKYVIRYNTTDCSETFSVKNSPALGTDADIRQYLISVGGTGTHGYKFIEWQFDGTKVETLVGETGCFTQEMIDYGMAHNNYIDFEALWTINKYAVRYVITDADGSNSVSYYSTTLTEIGEPFPEKYKDSVTGEEYNVSDVNIDYYDLVGWKYNYAKDPIPNLASATVTMDYLAFASLASHPVIGGVAADGVLTLTTEWTPTVYTVNFDPACPTSIRFPSAYVTIGDYFDIPDPSELTYSLYTIGEPEWFQAGNTSVTLRVSDGLAEMKETMADYAENKTVTFKVFWIYDSYTIEYTYTEDDVTGTLPLPTGQKYQVNAPVTIESAKDPQGKPYLQRVGYTLLGWNYKAGAEYAIVGTTTMSAEMARTANSDNVVFFYPVWGAQSYLIQYEWNGGTQGAYAPTSAFFGEDITISAPTYYGHTFTGWTATGLNERYAQVKAGSSYASWNGSLTRATVFYSLTDSESEPVILTANWSDAEYVIRYDANGGLGAAYGGDLKAKNGQFFTLASDKDGDWKTVLSKEGYTFTGWSVDGVEVIGGAGEEIKFTDRISTYVNDEGQVVIYAVWTYNSYTVHYQVMEGATTVDVPSFYDLPVTVGQPERNGYVFTGWVVTGITGGTVSTKARYSVDGSVWMPWADTSKGAVATFVMNLTSDPDADVYMIGTWAEQEYTLVYNANKGTGTLPPETSGCRVGHEFTLPKDPQLSKSGYSFAGWSFDKVNLITSNTFTLAMAEMADKNCRITVYAMWAAGSYSVKVSEREGSEITVLAYYDVSLSVGIPETPGYAFTGWSSDDINTDIALYSRDGVSWFNWTSHNDVIYAGHFMNLGDDGSTVNLSAQWTLVDYTLRYSPNGGVGEVPEDSNVYHIEDSITLASVKDAKLTNGDKILIGWALESDALYAQEISRLEEYMTYYANAGNIITLYAVWSERSYTVTVDIGDATPSSVPMGWTNRSPGIYTKQVEYGSSVEEAIGPWNAVTLSKEGYKFDCWVYGYDKVVTDMTVVAQYKVVSQSMIYILAAVLASVVIVVFVTTRIERR